MPFARPTLPELVSRITGDFRSRLSYAAPLLRRAMVAVLGPVWGGAAHLMHGHLEWNSRQIFPTTSDDDVMQGQAGMYGLGLTVASYASGQVTAVGENGAPIPEDEILVRPSDGVQYRVTADAVIASGTATVSVEAVEAGDAGNLAEGETLNFESPVDGVDSEVTVIGTDGISGGHDEGTFDELREEFLLHLREPPTGGSDQDYIAWGLEVPGVTRVWVYRHENGLGTVVVRFVLDGQEDIIPTGADVTAMQTKLDSERPITAEVTAEAPTELAVNFTLSITPDNAETRAAVVAELEDLFLREGEPGDGDERGVIPLSHIRTSLGIAEGVDDYTLASPAADIEPDVGELPRVGTVTFT